MDTVYKTRGVVLHTMKYGDSGCIVYMYTESHGRLSYYIRGDRNGKVVIGKTRMSLQSLTPLEYVANISNNGSLHKFKEAKRAFLTPNIIFDIRKSTIALYISELFYRVVKEQEPNPYLFDFLFQSIKTLDTLMVGIANFHIYFTIHLIQFLGFRPSGNWQEGMFFDIKYGKYVVIKPVHDLFFSVEESFYLNQFINTSIEQLEEIKINRNQRVVILEKMIRYLEYHHETHYKIGSIKILSEIF